MSTDAALAHHRDLVPFALLRLASDRHLVEQVQAGSERAFEALFDRHRAPLLAFCRQLLKSREEAEDVVQQTFLIAYRELVRSASPRALRPWLYGIARHRCLTALRARRDGPVEGAAEPAIDHLAVEVTARDDLRAILTDVARLPGDQRQALVLAELGDVSYEEIAGLLGCPREKVKALVYQARSSLAASRRARETPCAEIREQLATLRGGALRRTSLRRHLRDCAGCRAFRDEVRTQRGRLALVLPLSPIAALKRLVLGAVSGSGGGAGAAAVGVGTLSAGGLAATAFVTLVVPIGGIAVAVTALHDDRTGPQTLAPASRVVATMYAAEPARAAQDHARAESLATERTAELANADTRTRDDARADDWPSPAEATGTDTRPPAPENGTGRDETDDATSPGRRAPESSSAAPAPAAPVVPPRANGGAASEPAAASIPPSRRDARPTPAVPPRGSGHPTPPDLAAPPAPPKANPQPTPAAPGHHSGTPPAQAPANAQVPPTPATPSPTGAGTSRPANGDGR
jgi:RNA polymerase sigma factor (sigma-70 family)